MCGPSFITLQWNSVTSTDLPVLGYMIDVALYNSSLYSVVYDGSYDPDQLQYTVTGLVTGELYKFRVYSVNFNGMSDPSTEYYVYACGLP